MSDKSSPTVSITKVLTNIVNKSVATTVPMTTSNTLLYKAGSTLTPVDLGRISY